MGILLTPKEIELYDETLKDGDGYDQQFCDVDGLLKAQLKKVYDEFEGAGIYEIQKDGAYFWNPSKFRAFWEALHKEIE